MAPFDRRRRPYSSLSVVLCLLLFFSSAASASSAVLGIDFGTEYIKAVLVKPGIPLDIVLTKDSKRKEASAIAFKPGTSSTGGGSFPERLYGGDALALAARYPADVYPNLKPLLGVPFDHPTAVATYLKRHPAVDLVALPDRGTVAVKSGSFGSEEQQPFSVEELLAMELKNVRDNAKAMAGEGTEISSAVITIPPFYTADEKRAVQMAAELVGLKVMGLVSDGLAVGLNYATTRTFPSVSEGGKPEYHMVFDMGAGYTTATVLKFQGRAVKDVGRLNKTIQEVVVLGTSWDRSLGGDSFNDVILDDMLQKFVATPSAKKLDASLETVKTQPRAMARLLKDAEKVRQVLSANSDATVSFESLYNDIDFRYKLSRTEYEDMAKEYADRINKPIKEALESAKLEVVNLDSIILHGGAVRTPFVQKRLETLVGNPAKLRSNVNADEAAVFGAAFKGAGLSPSFKVKEIRDIDTAGYSVGIQYQIDGKDRRQKLFTSTAQLGTVKHLPLKNLDDFDFTLFQTISSLSDLSETDSPVLNVQTKNLTDSVKALLAKPGCDRENITASISVQLDPATGFPAVTKGAVSCEIDPDRKNGGVVDDVKGFFGFGSKKEEQEPLKEGEAPKSGSEESTTQTSSSAEPVKSKVSQVVEEAKPQPPKTKIESINLRLVSTPRGSPQPSREQLKSMKKRLAAFDASDKSRRVREEVLNTLEAFTYRARDLISDEDFVAVSTPSERSQIEARLQETSDWLYGDGARADMETLKARQKDLERLVGPIAARKEDASLRPDQIRQLQDALNQTSTFVKMMRETILQAEAAASSASAAAESSSSSSLPDASAPSSEIDPLAELEEPDSTSTSSSPNAAPTPETPLYTHEDLDQLSAVHESISTWLSAKLAEQDKLAPHEDAVLTALDVNAKAAELNNVVMEMVQRKIKLPTAQGKPRKPSSTKSKKTKTKSAKEPAPSDKDASAEKANSKTQAEEKSKAQRTRDEL